MRIWLDPSAMAARGITVDDVAAALNSQNIELPAGALEAQSKDFTIRVARAYSTPAQFAKMPIVPLGAAIRAAVAGAAAVGGTSARARADQGATNPLSSGATSGADVTRPGGIAPLG